jgi:transposase-like protein
MGIEGEYQKPRTTISAKNHKIYPYLLRDYAVLKPNEVWSTDITYIPMRHGYMYLTAIIDWYSRYVISWELSNTLETDFCSRALKRALNKNKPLIFNTDQGSQFTSNDFTSILANHDISISMDGKGRSLDNIFIERLWRTLKYENIYRHSYETVQELSTELLLRVKETSPKFFENLVIELLIKMGYGGSLEERGSVVGKSGDEGIDGVIKEDKLGLDIIYIQAKKWEGNVGRPEIQKFVGALQGQRAKKGIFITTSSFNDNAYEYVSKIDIKVVLINGEELANLMIDYNIGVALKRNYEIKKIDTDFFLEE